MAVASYNTTASLNTAINGVSVAEGMARADINNAIRELMADIKAFSATVPSGTIAIASGGTGQTTAVAALAALGGLPITFKELPQTAKSTGWTLALAESAGHDYYTGGAATATVPLNSGVAFPVGTAITIVNNGTGVLTIGRAAGVAMKWSNTGADADRSLAVGGMATLLKVATDLWFISGGGLS